MQFDLTPELAELQATVRKIAQEKVAPRAREIDTTATYPQDLFELFRDTGLLGLVVPEEYGGGGAGIMGLTLAIEEVAKYSNTAALMLLAHAPADRSGAHRRQRGAQAAVRARRRDG